MAHPSPNPEIKRPASKITLKARAFLMYHDMPSIIQPTKYGNSAMMIVGLRPSISADEPATIPPNNAPTGVIACN